MTDRAGEFSLKHTGSTYAMEDGHVVNYVNWEGTATGYGQILGTLRVGNPLSEDVITSRACSWTGVAYPDDGSSQSSHGEGTWEKVDGEHKWTVDILVKNSAGERNRCRGEIDLATRTFNGRFVGED